MTVSPRADSASTIAELLEARLTDSADLAKVKRTMLQLAAERRQARRELAEANLFWFARYYFANFFNNATPDFHWELADMARRMELPRSERGSMGFVVAAPRGHAKSTILTFLIVLYWIALRKKRFIVIVSDTATMAETFVNDVRKQLEENTRLREDFGDLCGDTVVGRPLKWTGGDFTAAHKDKLGRPTFTTRVLARSTGAQFRGLRSGAYRPDAVMCDDLENDELVRTPEQRAKIWEWFTKAVLPALDPENGAVFVIGTILHFDSLLQRLLKLAQSERLYEWRIYRAIKDDGSILWSDRFNKQTLADLRRILGTLAFNSEYLNIPIDEEARLYRPEWIKWYTGNELAYDKEARRWMWRGEALEVYVGVDPAIAENEQADYFAVVVLGVARESKSLVILYAFADRMDFPTQVQEIIRLDATWQPRQIGIEKNAYQRALPQQLMRESAKLTIKQLQNSAQKYTRILAASVPFENGQVYMRRAVEGEPGEIDETGQVRVFSTMQALYTQLMQYPMSANDDLCDSLENAMQVARIRARAFEGWF
jgi:phage terminase large subunit-like protein